MEVDFLEEAKKRKDEIIKDLVKIIKIESVNESFNPENKEAPFGVNLKYLLDVMMNMARSNQFYALNCDNYAMHIQLGNYKEYVGILGHLDVVPAGNNWTVPPFSGLFSDGRIYGRGAIDNKGGIIAAFYAMKILSELNIRLSKSVRLILGLDEETNWHSLDYYFNKFPSPVSGFVPDASFPVIYAEKGILTVKFKANIEDHFIVSFFAGTKDNVVCDKATVIVKDCTLIERFSSYLQMNMLKGESEIKGNVLELTIYGKQAHASTPEHGQNAIFLLVDFFNSIQLESPVFDMINQYFQNDIKGEKLNINAFHQEMQYLTTNCANVNYANHQLEILVNIRYVKDMEYELIKSNIEKTITDKLTYEVINHLPLLYLDPNSELISTLEQVYQKYTDDFTHTRKTIGGGTYARATKNVCAFGPKFFYNENLEHMPDEYIQIDDLILACAIYAEAIYHLAK